MKKFGTTKSVDSAKNKGNDDLPKKKASKNRFQAAKKGSTHNGLKGASAKETTFYIVRHGATEYNALGLVQGHRKIPLLPEGLEQATTCGLALDRMIRAAGATPRLVLASPVLRGEQTGRNIHAALVARSQPGDPEPQIVVDAAFAELNYGTLEGRKLADVSAQVNAIKQSWADGDTDVSFPGPQGESYADAMSRFCAGLAHHAKRNPGAHIAVATHSQVIEAILVHLGALTYSDTEARKRNVNCTVSILVYSHASESLSVKAAFQDVGARQLASCAVVTG